MFPVTLGGVTYTLADFYPQGYITALPNSVASCYDALLAGVVTTSTSSVAIGNGTKSFTIGTGLNFLAGDLLIIAADALPATKRMYAVVTSYNSSTGALVVDADADGGSGTYAAWTISPTLKDNPASAVPFPVFYGGIGGTENGDNALMIEAGLGFPTRNSQRVFDDFLGPVGTTSIGPWYCTADVYGAGAASVSTVSLAGSDTTVANYVGILCIAATGLSYETREGVNNGFVSYGKYGYLNCTAGGPIEWECSYRTSLAPETVVYRTRMGLRGNGSSLSRNFLDLYGMGFEVNTGNESGYICAVYASKGVRQVVNTGVYPSTGSFTSLKVRIDTFSQVASWYVDNGLVLQVSIAEMENTVEALLHPAFSHEVADDTEVKAYFDYVLCNQRVSRS